MSILGLLAGRERRDQWTREGILPLGGWSPTGSISQDEAVRIAAIQACVSLLADVVSTLPVDIIVREDDGTRLPGIEPAWLDAPVPDDPSITRIDHFSQVMWSLCLDGNSFTMALPNVYEPAELHVLNPTRVVTRKPGRYELRMQGGTETVGPDQIVHIARSRRAGDLRGMSPVEEAGTTFAMKRSADRFSERIFSNGVFLSGALSVPGPLVKDTLDQLKAELDEQYAGTNRAGRPGVFGNGAKWDVPHLNLGEMQLIELHHYAKLEAAGLFRVPPHLIGVTDPGAMSRASVESQAQSFATYTLNTYVRRIEEAYERLIPGAATSLRFNTDALLRADFKTRWEGYQIALASKVYKIDEVRTMEDRAPFGEGNGGGFLETPNNNAPGSPAAAQRAADEAASERRHLETMAAVMRESPVNVPVNITNPVNVTTPEVRVEPSVVNVTTPPVNVTMPEITVAAPEVTVPPAVVNVTVPEQRAVSRKIVRDKAVAITHIEES